MTTRDARLSAQGEGLIASLEAGYPVPLPFGPRFVLEPQAQIIWQRVDFGRESDAFGLVDLGTTSGTTSRLGRLGQWSIDRPATYSGVNQVPLREEATRLEFAAGVTTRIDRNFSLYAQAGYQFAVGDGGGRQGVQGDLGVRYSW